VLSNGKVSAINKTALMKNTSRNSRNEYIAERIIFFILTINLGFFSL